MTSRRTTPRPVVGMAALIALAALVTGCGDQAASTGGGSSAAETRDELAAHGGRPCPARLPQADDRGFGTDEPADEAPSLPDATRAWVCEYEPVDGPATGTEGGSALAWRSRGRPVELSATHLRTLEERLEELAPADAMRMCTEDLGPRWMVVLAHEGDLTGVVVDAFGCRDVRLTDEPFTTVPGEAEQPGTVSGVLSGPDDLLRLVKAARAMPTT